MNLSRSWIGKSSLPGAFFQNERRFTHPSKIHKKSLMPENPDYQTHHFGNQWLFLVPLKGGRDYIIPQLAGCLPLIYHL